MEEKQKSKIDDVLQPLYEQEAYLKTLEKKMSKKGFFENKIKEYYESFKEDLLKTKLNYNYVDKQIELLNYEYDLIKQTKSESKLVIAIMIKKGLSNMKIPFYTASLITSSYFAYLGGVHGIDTCKYNIKPEICYSFSEAQFNIDFHIPNNFKTIIYQLITSYIPDKFVYNVCYHKDDGPGTVFSSDDKKDKLIVMKYKKAICLDPQIREKLINVTKRGKNYQCIHWDEVRLNNDIIEINLRADIDAESFFNNEVPFELIDKMLEKNKDLYINEIDNNVLSLDDKKRLFNSIHNSYDLSILYSFLQNTYRECKLPASIKDIKEIIFRDDIYNYFLALGIKKEKAFEMMTSIRKGRYEQSKEMLEEESIDEEMKEKFLNILYVCTLGYCLSEVKKATRKILGKLFN